MRTLSLSATMLAAALAAAVVGCALKSPPTTTELQKEAMPHTVVPAAWKAGGSVAAPVVDRWLATFGEPDLNALIEEALAYNADLRVAAARVEQAAAYVKVAGGSLDPAVDVLGRAAIKDAGGTQGGGLSVSWELDLWGRLRYGVRAAESQYASAQADYAYARQSLGALVARGWFLATETALQRQLAQEIVGSSERLVRLAQERQRVGNGDALDVATAEASLGGYRDALRQVELAQEQSLRAIELLLGRYPGRRCGRP
jgi:outer membrane protein TolC